MEKPNIIFLMTDQQRWDCLGVLNEKIKTPHLDKLAKKGILYNQTVCQCPMCVPSRNSMMFGLYPSQLGVRTNAGGLFYEGELTHKALPELLKDGGYQTAGFGKTHWNHGIHNPHPSKRGFDIRVIGQPARSELYEEGALMMGDDNPAGLDEYFKETAPYGEGEENSRGYLGTTSAVKPVDHRDGWVAEKCLEFLKKDVDPNSPLFLYLSFLKPHAGFNVPKEFEDLYDINEIPDVINPPWKEEQDTHLASFRSGNPHYNGIHREREGVWQQLTGEERKRTTLRYWANCSWLDSYFGQVLSKLEELGRLDNCLIVYTSDHGDMMGERNHTFSKYCLYDSSVRVPLILSGSIIPEDRQGSIDERPAELVDLLPSLLASAGQIPHPTLPGLNLLSEDKRKGNFCEFHGGGSEKVHPGPSYMWRNRNWKLILYMPGDLHMAMTGGSTIRCELYDLNKDPLEYENLYDHETVAAIREQMKTELLMHLACSWSKVPRYYDTRGYEKISKPPSEGIPL